VEILGPPDTVLCAGSPLFPLLVNDTIGFWFGQFILTNNEGRFFQPIVPGDYTIFYQRGFDLCRRADTIQIRVVPSNAVKAGEDLVLCSTQSEVTLIPASAGGVFEGYALNGNTVQLSALQLDSTYTYTYLVDSLPAACNSDTRTIRVEPPPIGGFDLSRDTLCQGDLLTVIPSFPSGVSYSILWGDGGTLSPSLTHSYTDPGTYQINYQAFTLNPLNGQPLCTIVDSTEVVVPEPVAPGDLNFSLSTEQGCAPLTISFENLSTNLPDFYLWEFGNGQQYFGNTPPPILFEQGIEDTLYWVRLLVPNGCGASVVEKTIKVFAQPMANFGLSNSQPCSGALVEASLLSTGTPSTNQFFTSTGQQGTAVYEQPSYFQFYTDTVPQTIGIWLVSQNACGIDTAFQELVLQPTDVVALIGLPDTTTLCQDLDFAVFNYATPGAPIRWSISDGNTYLGDSITLHFDEPGTYSLTLYAYGCGFDSITVPINVYPKPDLAVTHDLKNCPEDPIQFQLNSHAPGVMLQFGDGDSTFQKSVSHLYPAPGTYFPSAHATSDRGCTSTWTGTLTILEAPTAQTAVADSICAGEPVSYAGSSNLPGSTCTWVFGDGNLAQGCLQSHIFEQHGLYTSILKVISAEGCVGADTVPVYVRVRPEAGITYDLNNPCAQEAISFQSTSSNSTGLFWQLSDGFSGTSTSFLHSFAQPGTYSVQLVATNEGICFDTTAISLQLRSAPDFGVMVETPCTVQEGSKVQIQTGPENFVQLVGGSYSQIGNQHQALPAGEYQISVISPEGCELDTIIQIVPPNELLLDVAQDSFLLLLGEQAVLEAITNQPATFEWEPSLYLDDPFYFQPTTTPWESVRYLVTATNALGCSKLDTVWVCVKVDREASLFIPNAFTPNQDGINDIFYIRSDSPTIQGIEQFQVFDKYNENVFDVDQLDTVGPAVPEDSAYGWDGQFRGQKAEAGSYRYVIRIRYIDQTVKTFTGTVQLIR
jgi:gliding motility-associated-like protein